MTPWGYTGYLTFPPTVKTCGTLCILGGEAYELFRIVCRRRRSNRESTLRMQGASRGSLSGGLRMVRED